MSANTSRWRVAAALVVACVGWAGTAAPSSSSDPAPPPAPKKVLRYAFENAETSLDPVKIGDLYSRTLTAHIFEAMYAYDPLARPVKIKPLTADGMPEVSADFRVWTVKIKPGIYFADDPAFKGKKRELVAQDYVYAFKRFADPANLSPVWTSLESDGIIGLTEAHQAAVASKKPFDYDREISGLRALDRYTFRLTMNEPRPRYIETLAASDLFGAVPREAIEFYGDQFEAHPVGTGPFKLAQWRRSSFIAFERNPDYRERYYDAEPSADDTEGQAILSRLKGRCLPMLDRVEVSIIEEAQPRWLSFINGEADLAYKVGDQFVVQAMPNGKVAPNLAKKGLRGYRITEPAMGSYFFNMDDATVGGYGVEKVALRRAIALGMDAQRVIDYAFNGQGTVAQGVPAPFTDAFDPRFKSEFGDYDPARANALLDLYGYVDRNGDGWRDMSDGSRLLLRVATQADQRSRRIAEVMQKNMNAIGIRMESAVAQWPENLKAARAGRLQMWFVNLSSAGPDAEGQFARFDSRQIGGQNLARVKLPALDELHSRIERLPQGPERLAAYREAERIALAYMPYKIFIDRGTLDMSQPQLVGYRRPVFWQDFWQYVDIDPLLRSRQ